MDIDPTGLEAGESPGSTSKERAAYWVEFYEGLVAFESEILRRMEELAEGLSDEHRRAVETTNLQPMRDLIADFRRRVDVWRAIA